MPSRVEELVEDFGDDLDELVDLKALLSRELEKHPDMMNRIFQQAGAVELQSVINRGAIIGGILGQFWCLCGPVIQSPGCCPSGAL